MTSRSPDMWVQLDDYSRSPSSLVEVAIAHSLDHVVIDHVHRVHPGESLAACSVTEV